MPPTWISENTGVTTMCSGTAHRQVWAAIGARRYSHAIAGISARTIAALEHSHSVGSHHLSWMPSRAKLLSAVNMLAVQIANVMPPKTSIWRASSRRRMSASVKRGAGAAAAIGQSDVAREIGSKTGVGGRRQRQQALLVGIGKRERRDEHLQCFARDALATRQRLQLFVRFRQTVAAHHRLDGFSQHFPACVEVGGDAIGVDFQLAESLLQRRETDQRVPEGLAQRAQR